LGDFMSRLLLSKLNNTLASGELFQYVDDCLSVAQVLSKLGYAKKGQYISIVKEFLGDNEIDTSHFTVNGKPPLKFEKRQCLCCGSTFTTEMRPSNDQVTCSRACSNTYFRTKDGASTYRERALRHYGCTCNACGFTNLLALEVHHIDKNRENNSLDNLVVLCANCHRITHGSE
jgi:hypothetical protein